MIGDDFTHSKTVEFVCDENEILLPKTSKILTCEDGKWNGPLPSCKGMK
jgi:hypothetical protein